MGLAGAKNRTKISKDPNNNNWAKNTTSFGHKILSSQGWKPGQYLGASDAAHAEHYTQANASHIRVLLRDDNLGLGAAKAGARNAETFGLLQFSGLLGRLNGKDATVLAKEECAKRDVQLSIYQGRKYGTMNFVSAGYLVGDKIRDSPVDISDNPLQSSQLADTTTSKKRKRGDRDEDEQQHTDLPTASKAEKRADQADAVQQASTIEKPDGDAKESKAARRARKEAKRQEKQARAEAKVERRKAKAAKKQKLEQADPESDSSSDSADDAATTAKSVPVPQAVAVPRPDLSRFAVRKRYIQQKRMAGMDPQAMREVSPLSLLSFFLFSFPFFFYAFHNHRFLTKATDSPIQIFMIKSA